MTFLNRVKASAISMLVALVVASVVFSAAFYEAYEFLNPPSNCGIAKRK